jgi:hypothetical protein
MTKATLSQLSDYKRRQLAEQIATINYISNTGTIKRCKASRQQKTSPATFALLALAIFAILTISTTITAKLYANAPQTKAQINAIFEKDQRQELKNPLTAKQINALNKKLNTL